jgi:hypothetical protein
MAERGGFEPPVPFRIYKAKLSAQVARFSATELPSELTENFFASTSARLRVHCAVFGECVRHGFGGFSDRL